MPNRYLLRGSLLLAFLTLPVLFDPGSQAMAQDCASELADANQAYTFGRFDEAIALLDRCLSRGDATSQEQQQAHRLLALNYIGKDDPGSARENVEALLRLNPDYEPDPEQDPPPFVEMVTEARREVARVPQQEETPEVEVEDEGGGGGAGKILLIGGGVALAAVAAVLLAGGGGNDDGGGMEEPPQPTTLNEVEPNNGRGQAQVLSGNPPITLNGNVDVADEGDLGLRFDLDGDDEEESFDDFEDWFRVTTTQPGLSVSLSGFNADLDLYLISSGEDGTIFGQSTNSGTQSETINDPSLAAGTYLIAVTIFDPNPGANNTSYRLVVNGSISGSNLRVAVEEIQHVGGAEVAGQFRLVAHPAAGTPLTAALPDPNVVAWTAYHDDGGALVEYDGTETFDFRAGRGFWVRSTEPFSINAAPTRATDDPYAIPLEAGWNVIANPSEASIDWAAVQAANGVTQSLWRWDGSFVEADTFEPARQGEAYYFLNASGREALTIPRRSLSAITARRRTPFALTLSAYREGRRAAVARVGFAEDAAPGLDGLDQYAPPGYFEAASLRLIRPVSSRRHVELASEFRPWGEAGERFELLMKAPVHAPIELRVEGLDAFADYDVYLIDREKAVAYNLHEQPVLTLTSSQTLRRFTLVVGDATFAGAARADLAPEAISLGNYPNPFNPRTQITYTVPAAAAQERVHLDVYDVAGRLVRVLVDSVQEPGAHQVEWDGTDASGVPVTSGVYLYRLQAGGNVRVQRMLLMK